MTLSEAASVADLSRATARRVLRTLAQLGYVVQDGRTFALSPRILELGFAYLSTPELDRPRAADDARAQRAARRILLGARSCRASRSSMSRACRRGASCRRRCRSAAGCRRFTPRLGAPMLGYLDDAEIWRRLKSQRIEAYTPQTITDLQALFDRIRADREQGFSIVDEELERGLRAIAVPVLDRTGQAVGAINLSTHATRTTRNEMREHFLPELQPHRRRRSRR